MGKKNNSLKLSFKFEKNTDGKEELKVMDIKKEIKKEKKIKEKKEKSIKINKQPKNVANSLLLEEITKNLKN
jgi:hypothetical protein